MKLAEAAARAAASANEISTVVLARHQRARLRPDHQSSSRAGRRAGPHHPRQEHRIPAAVAISAAQSPCSRVRRRNPSASIVFRFPRRAGAAADPRHPPAGRLPPPSRVKPAARLEIVDEAAICRRRGAPTERRPGPSATNSAAPTESAAQAGRGQSSLLCVRHRRARRPSLSRRRIFDFTGSHPDLDKFDPEGRVLRARARPARSPASASTHWPFHRHTKLPGGPTHASGTPGPLP